MEEQLMDLHPDKGQDDAQMAGDRTTETVVRALLDFINDDDRSGFSSTLASDAIQLEPAVGVEYRGPSDIAANIWSYRNTFPDLHLTTTNLFACGNHAVAELTLRGTYEPYTYGDGARTISWHGCFVMEIQNNKVSRIIVYADRLNILDQLGALPLAPEASSPSPHGFFYRRLEPIVHGSSSSRARHDDV